MTSAKWMENSNQVSKESLLATAPIGDDKRAELMGKHVLLMPETGYLDVKEWYFPGGTYDLVQFLQDNESDELSIGICLEDNDFQELVLRHDVIPLVSFVVQHAAFPLLVQLVSHYLLSKYGKKLNDSNLRTSWNVIDEQEGKSYTFIYDGPASEFSDAVSAMMKTSHSSPDSTGE